MTMLLMDFIHLAYFLLALYSVSYRSDPSTQVVFGIISITTRKVVNAASHIV